MERFSWTDNLRAAFAPCLACLQPRRDDADDDDERQLHNHHFASRGPDYVPRARADELEGLLQDSDDAETLSLHSNLGRDDPRKRKRRRPRRAITLFGFNLFGKPPIQLPEDDDESPSARSRTISASTLDSDAAPLDPSTIAQLSAARAAEGAAQREAERLAKEERRRRRREKRAAKEAALALALEHSQDEFEGFPGSGPSYFLSPDTDAPSSSGYSQEEFGPFEHAPQLPQQEDADVDGADFGADVYAQRPRRGSVMARSASDSQSRTSGTESLQHHAQPPPPSRTRSSRRSNSTASQSLSISSPPPHAMSFPVVAPQDMMPLPEEPSAADTGDVITIDTPNGFPSLGFSGGMRRKNSEAGVFLARRGDE